MLKYIHTLNFFFLSIRIIGFALQNYFQHFFKQIRAILCGEETLEEEVNAEAEEGQVIAGKKEGPVHSTLDSGIDISVTDIQGSDW